MPRIRFFFRAFHALTVRRAAPAPAQHKCVGTQTMRLKTQDIDPKKLIYYTAVVEQGSLRKAAKLLNVSQPALSTSMSRLESELGLKLIERGSSGVSPTAFGDMLYSHSRMIRDEIHRAERNLFQEQFSDHSTIRFGSILSMTSYIVPAAVTRWREAHPSCNLRVVGEVQFDLLNALLRREIDLFVGFSESYGLLDGLRQRVLFRDKLSVIARPKHPLFSQKPLTLKSLSAFPWVFVPSGPFNIAFENVLEGAGIRLLGGNTICNSIALLKSLIGCSDHIGLLPENAIPTEMADGRLASLPITIPEFSRDIAVFFREGHELDARSRDLVDCIQAIGLELNRASENRRETVDAVSDCLCLDVNGQAED
jgi:DNA-binding transcriptional LysR family regulator